MGKAYTEQELEDIQDKARRLMSSVPALCAPFTTVMWQEWVLVPFERAERGSEASAMTIASLCVKILSSVGPIIKALGGDPRGGWDVGGGVG